MVPVEELLMLDMIDKKVAQINEFRKKFFLGVWSIYMRNWLSHRLFWLSDHIKNDIKWIEISGIKYYYFNLPIKTLTCL